jgi:CRISPR-associated protein Csy2
MEPEALLVLPRMRIQNVNIISSPMTWGFPSPSAFTGFVHALHRRLHASLELAFDGVGIVCHDFEMQASKPPGKHHRVFHLTRNPLGKDEKAAAIVEEGRAHVTVSLIIGVSGAGLYAGSDLAAIARDIADVASNMRLAGGSIQEPAAAGASIRNTPSVHLLPATEAESRQFNKRIARALLPGFVLVSREGVLEAHWQSLREKDPAVSMLEAFLDLSSLAIEPIAGMPASDSDDSGASVDAHKERVEWVARPRKGWLVPIPAGYNALTRLHPPGTVKKARDRTVPFRFVEGLCTIGEWISPLRVEDLRQILWVHQADEQLGSYRWTTPHFASSIDREGN